MSVICTVQTAVVGVSAVCFGWWGATLTKRSALSALFLSETTVQCLLVCANVRSPKRSFSYGSRSLVLGTLIHWNVWALTVFRACLLFEIEIDSGTRRTLAAVGIALLGITFKEAIRRMTGAQGHGRATRSAFGVLLFMNTIWGASEIMSHGNWSVLCYTLNSLSSQILGVPSWICEIANIGIWYWMARTIR
ncbi:hypothetical protein BC832DRAFT_263701 [Gaertneriomyces semiglobifer]|nr:hypothetical protein BC832DRAFT_263701 [Gaertneriomyces semiglobifer]